jgi:hypothetical protein
MDRFTSAQARLQHLDSDFAQATPAQTPVEAVDAGLWGSPEHGRELVKQSLLCCDLLRCPVSDFAQALGALAALLKPRGEAAILALKLGGEG